MRRQRLVLTVGAADVQMATSSLSTTASPLHPLLSHRRQYACVCPHVVTCAVLTHTTRTFARAKAPWCRSAMRDAMRAFHHTTPVCLKMSDGSHSPSVRSSSRLGGERAVVEGAAGAASPATASPPSAATAAATRKSRKRSATASAAGVGTTQPKKRGRRPASDQTGAPPAATTAAPTATQRGTRKASSAAKRRSYTTPGPHADSVSARAPVGTTPTVEDAPSRTGARTSSLSTSPPRSPPPRSTGAPHCITKRSRASTTARVRGRSALDSTLASEAERSAPIAPVPHEPHPMAASTAATVPQSSTPFAPSRRGATTCTPATTVTPYVYYSNSTVADTSALSDEGIVAERASLTKLFMVSDSVASIFCVLPHDDVTITNYLDDVDRATPARDARPTEGAAAHDKSEEEAAASRMIQDRDIQSRVLVEERANHTLCIHVRDMEQLVAPPHLLSDSPPPAMTPVGSAAADTSLDLSGKAAKGRRGKGKAAGRKRGKGGSSPANDTPGISSTAAPAPPPTPALSPLERLIALREWHRQALAKARLSQQRWVVPDDYHAITRVRFHDPHKADLTLVQGAGGSKSVEDVLEAMNRQLGHGHGTRRRTRDDEGRSSPAAASLDVGEADALDELSLLDTVESHHHTVDASFAAPASALMGGTIAMTTPYALKPLLTVYASTIPRREPLFGIRTDQRQFLSRLTVEDEDGHEEDVDASSQVSAFSPNPITEEEAYAMIQQYVRVPPIPRFLTRITLLVEHSELEPVDLLSIAEVTTARKDGASGANVADAVGKKEVSRGSPVAPDQAAHTTGAVSGRASTCAVENFVPPTPRIYCLIIDGGEV